MPLIVGKMTGERRFISYVSHRFLDNETQVVLTTYIEDSTQQRVTWSGII